MVKIRLAIPVLAVFAALFAAGCGGSGSGGSSASSGLADLASPGSLVFVEGQLQPKGALKQNVDSVAKTIHRRRKPRRLHRLRTGKLGRQRRRIVRLRQGSRTVARRKGGVAFERLDRRRTLRTADRDPDHGRRQRRRTSSTSAPGRATTRPRTSPTKASTSRSAAPKDNAVGVIGETLVLADSEKEFKAAVDASEGDSLGGEDRFQDAIAGGLRRQLRRCLRRRRRDHRAVRRRGSTQQTQEVLESAGIDPSEATAVASVIPQSDQIEVDLSSDLGGENAPGGDASELLGSLPASSFAAFAFSEFGEQLEEAIDSLDEDGIPPDLQPGELKSTLKQAGIDLDKIAASLEDARGLRRRQQPRAASAAPLVVTSQLQRSGGRDRQPRHAAARRPAAGHHRGQRQGERLLDPQRRTWQKAARRGRQRRPDRDRLRPGAGPRRPQRRLAARPSPARPATRRRSRRWARRRSAPTSTGPLRCAWPKRSCRARRRTSGKPCPT